MLAGGSSKDEDARLRDRIARGEELHQASILAQPIANLYRRMGTGNSGRGCGARMRELHCEREDARYASEGREFCLSRPAEHSLPFCEDSTTRKTHPSLTLHPSARTATRSEPTESPPTRSYSSNPRRHHPLAAIQLAQRLHPSTHRTRARPTPRTRRRRRSIHQRVCALARNHRKKLRPREEMLTGSTTACCVAENALRGRR